MQGQFPTMACNSKRDGRAELDRSRLLGFRNLPKADMDRSDNTGNLRATMALMFTKVGAENVA